MKDTFYFSHDYNTRSDEKIKLLIRKHGMNGYGIFWAIIEDLYNNANALRTDYDGIAYDLRTHCDIVKSIINDFDLFVIKDDFFGSFSVERRISERNSKSISARKSALSRWGKSERNANAYENECERNAIKERKGKEIKESKVKEREENTPAPEKNRFLIEIQELENYLVSQEQWIDVICMQNKIDKRGAADLIRKFVEKLKSENVKDKTPADACSHFANWLKYELPKAQENGTKKQQDNTSGFSRKGYDPNNGIGDGKLMSATRRPTIFGSDGTITKGTV